MLNATDLVVVANQSSSVFSQDVSGIFGLGTNSRDGNFSDTVFAGWLSRNPSESAFTYGMALNPPRKSSSDGGILHWVAPDTSFYKGSVSWKDMLPSNATSVNADWTVQLDSLSFSDAAINISRQNNDLKAIVDPYFTNIYIPQSLAGSICMSYFHACTEKYRLIFIPLETRCEHSRVSTPAKLLRVCIDSMGCAVRY